MYDLGGTPDTALYAKDLLGQGRALASEMALILEVKLNITGLDNPPDLPHYPKDWQKEFDIVFIPEGNSGCPSKQELKYFYSGPDSGWKNLCVSGTDNTSIDAVREILTYLNETGIFAQLYATYVQP